MTMTGDLAVGVNARAGLVRILAAGVATIVFIDAASVRAPGLALLGVPFLVAAICFKRAAGWGSALLLAWCCLYVLLGVNYAVGNGVDAPWGDLLFAYVGTPLAAVTAVVLARQVLSRRIGR